MQIADYHRNRKLVLLVDDRTESRELIADELEDLGLQVVQAVTRNTAKNRLAKYSPVPGRDGLPGQPERRR